MTTERDRIQHRTTEETQYVAKQTRIDLDAFLALSSDERGARWRQWDVTAKMDAVIQQLDRMRIDWNADVVDAWIARYDAKWENGHALSDLPIPPAAEILAVVKDSVADAQ